MQVEFVNTSGPEPWKNQEAKRFVRSHAMKDFRRKQREVTKKRKDDLSQPGEGSFVVTNKKRNTMTDVPQRIEQSPDQENAAVAESHKPASGLIMPTTTAVGKIVGLKILDAKFSFSIPDQRSPLKAFDTLPQIFPLQEYPVLSRLPSPLPSLNSDTSDSSLSKCSPTAPRVSSSQQDFDLSICIGVYGALHAAGANFEQFTQHFFKSVHSYMTILHRHRFLKCVHALSQKANAEVALLLLCMRLVAEPVQSGIDLSGGTLYLVAKDHFNSICSIKGPSLELVQAGSLLTLFEHNAYLRHASHSTLSRCCAMATLLGFNASNKDKMSVSDEERRRCYWGLLSLDCAIALHDEKRERSLLLPGPLPEDSLPTVRNADFECAVDDLPTPEEIFFVQSKLPTWADSFSRQGQSVQLISMVQRLVREPFEANPDLMVSKIELLDGLIVSSLHNLLADCNGNTTQHCGPISFLIAASYLLHEYQLQSTITCAKSSGIQASERSKLAIETMIEMMVSILREFPVSHTPELSPAALFGPYMASMLGLQLDRINGLRRPSTLGGNNFELLVNGLRHFSTVWPCTGEYVKLIERARSRSLPMPLPIT